MTNGYIFISVARPPPSFRGQRMLSEESSKQTSKEVYLYHYPPFVTVCFCFMRISLSVLEKRTYRKRFWQVERLERYPYSSPARRVVDFLCLFQMGATNSQKEKRLAIFCESFNFLLTEAISKYICIL